jgi:CHAD domain-containing protein
MRAKPHALDTHEMKRILRKQIDNAHEALAGKRVTDRAVHTARKCIKKARSTLRLIRDAISDGAYRHENAMLRDAGRPLSARRDATILIEALEKVMKPEDDATIRSSAHTLHRILERERRQIKRSSSRSPDSPTHLRRELRVQSERVARMSVARQGWSVVGRGLKRVYTHGRNSLADARESRSADCLHEWRKQVKYLWHQLQLLEPVWPGPIGELADQAHTLADYLGDDHDLAVLSEKVVANARAFADRGSADALLGAIGRCRKRLQQKSLVLGSRIYEERADKFATRLGRYWRVWKQSESSSKGR